MRALSLAVTALVLAEAAPSAWAQTPSNLPQVEHPAPKMAAKIPASAFADQNGYSEPMLSPDGAAIAVRSISKGTVSVAVIDAVSREVRARFSVPGMSELRWFRWAGSSRLLISLATAVPLMGEEVRISRLETFDVRNSQIDLVGLKKMGFVGDDLQYVDPKGEYVQLAVQKSIFDYPEVWRFQLASASDHSGQLIQPAKDGVLTWMSDSTGVVRMGFEATGFGAVKVWYRAKPEEKLRKIAKITESTTDEELWDVVRIVSGSDEGYVLRKGDSGRVELRKFNYATRTAGESVYAAPGWDVERVELDDQDKPLAAYYTDDRKRVVWFDPRYKSLQKRLENALKGKDVRIVSRAENGSRAIVWAGHEDDPGGYYIYTAAKATLDPFSAIRAGLDPADLASPKPVTYTTRDKQQIHAYLTLPRGRTTKKLPLILLPHGGPYGVRDSLDFDAEVQFLANRGYAVLQPNFRGSGGYGEDFEKLGDGQIGRAMQDDLDDAMDWAVAQGLADPARVCVVGSSYGGYAALWAVTRNPERYRCAASLAGVTDLKKQLNYSDDFVSSQRARKWRARYTGDAKFDLAQVSPLAQLPRLTRPVLLGHGDADSVVPFTQFKLMRDAAKRAGKPVQPIAFAGEGHGFSKPENFTKWLEALEVFLAKNNPAD